MSRRRALRRRYGRADLRKAWSVLHRGEHMGYIHAHDRSEALAIAYDAAPPMWRKGDINVEAANFGHARASVQMFPAFDPSAPDRARKRSQALTAHDAPAKTRSFSQERTREVQYMHWGHSHADTLRRRLAGAHPDELREKLRFYEATFPGDSDYATHQEAARTIRSMMRGAA